MTITFESDGLGDAADYFLRMPEISARAMSRAINRVVSRNGMRLVQDMMYYDVNFPKGYISGDRLSVGRFSTETSLEATIVGRKVATSLARFQEGGVIGGGQFLPGGKSRAVNRGVTVQVRNAGAKLLLKKAFLVRLKKGASLDEDNYNVGLAIRVKEGDEIFGKYSEHRSWLIPGRVALLYGPSVDQVFRDVADRASTPLAQLVADEFYRQIDVLQL